MSSLDLPVPETLRWQQGQFELLDQRRLPHEICYLRIDTLEDAFEAIRTLAVRGAPAIGVAAAYALAQAQTKEKQDRSLGDKDFVARLEQHGSYLKRARPTAVNLAWAVDRLIAIGKKDPRPEALVEAAETIHQQDLSISEAIGRNGAALIKAGEGILTHCNAGSLATSRLGTATAPMYFQHNAGVQFQVFADETRPLYQGARLTAWELSAAGIDTTLICDNMAATLMAGGHINAALVGTDRVTANGDVVNKIGTLNVAILCRHFDIPFYVACPSSTFDRATATGNEVTIEERDASEVLGEHAASVKVRNPAFDVTPAALVAGIVTEYGVHAPQDLKDALPP